MKIVNKNDGNSISLNSKRNILFRLCIILTVISNNCMTAYVYKKSTIPTLSRIEKSYLFTSKFYVNDDGDKIFHASNNTELGNLEECFIQKNWSFEKVPNDSCNFENKIEIPDSGNILLVSDDSIFLGLVKTPDQIQNIVLKLPIHAQKLNSKTNNSKEKIAVYKSKSGDFYIDHISLQKIIINCEKNSYNNSYSCYSYEKHNSRTGIIFKTLLANQKLEIQNYTSDENWNIIKVEEYFYFRKKGMNEYSSFVIKKRDDKKKIISENQQSALKYVLFLPLALGYDVITVPTFLVGMTAGAIIYVPISPFLEKGYEGLNQLIKILEFPLVYPITFIGVLMVGGQMYAYDLWQGTNSKTRFISVYDEKGKYLRSEYK